MAKKTAKKKTAKKTTKGGTRASRGQAPQAAWTPPATLSEQWAANRTKTGGNPDIPDGDYVGEISSCRFIVDRKGNANIPIGLIITRGEFEGEQPTAWLRFNSEISMQQTARALGVLGFDTAELEPGDFPEVAEEIDKQKGTLLRFRVRNRDTEQGEFQDVFINEVLES